MELTLGVDAHCGIADVQQRTGPLDEERREVARRAIRDHFRATGPAHDRGHAYALRQEAAAKAAEALSLASGTQEGQSVQSGTQAQGEPTGTAPAHTPDSLAAMTVTEMRDALLEVDDAEIIHDTLEIEMRTTARDALVHRLGQLRG